MPDCLFGDCVKSRTLDELEIGDFASLSITITERDIKLFSAMRQATPAYDSANINQESLAIHTMIRNIWGCGLIACLLGTKLPGLGAICHAQERNLSNPIQVGDKITATVVVTEKCVQSGETVFACSCVNQDNGFVLSGRAQVRPPPTQEASAGALLLPTSSEYRHAARLIAEAAEGPPTETAVVFPADAASLREAVVAAEAGLIHPTLIGPADVFKDLADTLTLNIRPFSVIHASSPEEAASTAVRLAREGQVKMLMKGDLHTSVLMHPIVQSEGGLKARRRISHVFFIDVPSYPRPLLISDAAINVAPNLSVKADIVRNAIDFAHLVGIAVPRVAILAAEETVSENMAATLDAAALCKMADRGQIKGAILDGPLAFDNAISQAAADIKGIVSKVAGCADILLVPDLEAGNILAKQSTFISGAVAAGLVLGARVPIVLSSRADGLYSRQASCAAGVLVARALHDSRSEPANGASRGP
jgi:phosphotransacetylase